MEWFKHKTSAHMDPVVSDAWDEFGDAAYVIWFVLLEIYGQNYNSAKPDRELNVSRAFVQRSFRKSWATVERVLNYYATSGKLELKIEGKRVIIKIPRFTEILSNWTKRQTTKPTEAPTESPTAKRRVREDKEKEKTRYTEKFLEFWRVYPKKIGKGAAYKSWQKIEITNGLFETILSAVRHQSKCEQWQRENGQFIPHPATWLNQRRWEDEICIKPEKDITAWRKKILN